MSVPPLADLDAFEARSPVAVTAVDVARVAALLDDASAIVRAEAGRTWLDDEGDLEAVPGVVSAIVVAVAIRAYTNPEGVTARTKTIGGASESEQFSQSSTSHNVYLLADERRYLRLALGINSIVSVPLVRPDMELIGTTYLEIEGGGEPIPWLASDDR